MCMGYTPAVSASRTHSLAPRAAHRLRWRRRWPNTGRPEASAAFRSAAATSEAPGDSRTRRGDGSSLNKIRDPPLSEAKIKLHEAQPCEWKKDFSPGGVSSALGFPGSLLPEPSQAPVGLYGPAGCFSPRCLSPRSLVVRVWDPTGITSQQVQSEVRGSFGVCHPKRQRAPCPPGRCPVHTHWHRGWGGWRGFWRRGGTPCPVGATGALTATGESAPGPSSEAPADCR